MYTLLALASISIRKEACGKESHKKKEVYFRRTNEKIQFSATRTMGPYDRMTMPLVHRFGLVPSEYFCMAWELRAMLDQAPE